MAARGKLVESRIENKHPELIEMVRTYNNEALQGRNFLSNKLKEIAKGSNILEVGGGSLALAVQLASEGYEVTVIEPVGAGFQPLHFILSEYLKISNESDFPMKFFDTDLESFSSNQVFSMAFSINVFEHVENIETAISHLSKLKWKSFYIYCPNYDFPFEPHFNKFLYRRRNSAFYLPFNKIKNSSKNSNQDLYSSINFITYKHLKRVCLDNMLTLIPNKRVSLDLIERNSIDCCLRERHQFLAKVATFLNRTRLHHFLRFLPLSVSPLIDVKLINLRI